MLLINAHQHQLRSEGYTILKNILDENEIEQIAGIIDQSTACNSNFRKSADLFAIRQFLKEIPQAIPFKNVSIHETDN